MLVQWLRRLTFTSVYDDRLEETVLYTKRSRITPRMVTSKLSCHTNTKFLHRQV